jgi:hypothetical protein
MIRLILRSGPLSAFTRIFDALWGRVSKDEAASCFETHASRAPQHEAMRANRRASNGAPVRF